MTTWSAGLTECRELYALSGWREEDDGDYYRVWSAGSGETVTPAYTVDTLLGMLPAHELIKRGDATWRAEWHGDVNGVTHIIATSRTNPANALARLAIELFHRGILLGTSGVK